MTFLQMVARLILVICLLSSPARALAWGIGHNSQADQVLRALPNEFLRHFDERQRLDFVVHYSHYTDYYTAREPKHRSEPAAETCAEAVRRLKFNPHKTQFVFPLFVEALREERHEDALMWAACLAHSIGDMGALNHPDLLWFSHVCLGDSGVMGPGGKSVPAVFAPDAIYGRSYFEEEFQPIYDEAMDGYVGRIISDDPQAVLEHLIVRDHLRKEEMNADLEVLQIFLLMEQYSRDGLPATYRKITEGLAAYTAKTNREILDTLATGFAFAQVAGDAGNADLRYRTGREGGFTNSESIPREWNPGERHDPFFRDLAGRKSRGRSRSHHLRPTQPGLLRWMSFWLQTPVADQHRFAEPQARGACRIAVCLMSARRVSMLNRIRSWSSFPRGVPRASGNHFSTGLWNTFNQADDWSGSGVVSRRQLLIYCPREGFPRSRKATPSSFHFPFVSRTGKPKPPSSTSRRILALSSLI